MSFLVPLGGGEVFDFLYPNVGRGKLVELRPGVAYCLRQFYGLVADLVRGAWTRYVRRHNLDLLGTKADLSEFLFGSERTDLSSLRPILEELQSHRCFYCEKKLNGNGHVDHFIPWSRYPLDLGHNFVAAHQRCNSAKADHLAAVEFLGKWVHRNQQFQDDLCQSFEDQSVLYDHEVSLKIAEWSYTSAEMARGLTWKPGQGMIALPNTWREWIE